MSFPPPAVDVRSLDQIVGEDPLEDCRKAPRGSTKPSAKDRLSRWALIGTMAGICLGLVVKVGVFAHAQPQAQAQVVKDPVPVEASQDPPEIPTLVVDEVVIVSKPLAGISKPPAKISSDAVKCHRENGVRVCRPDSVAASPRPERRPASLLSKPYR